MVWNKKTYCGGRPSLKVTSDVPIRPKSKPNPKTGRFELKSVCRFCTGNLLTRKYHSYMFNTLYYVKLAKLWKSKTTFENPRLLKYSPTFENVYIVLSQVSKVEKIPNDYWESTTTFEIFADYWKIRQHFLRGSPIFDFFFYYSEKNAQNAQNAAEMLSGRHRVAFFIAKISPWPVHNNFFRFLPFAGLP